MFVLDTDVVSAIMILEIETGVLMLDRRDALQGATIFLRHASNRYDDALAAIQTDQAAGLVPKRKRDLLLTRLMSGELTV